MAETGQNGTDERLTPRQLAVLEAASEAGMKRTIVAVCQECRVPRSRFYDWLNKNEAFRAAWEAAWHGTIRRHLPGIVAAQLHKALDGDTVAARLLMEAAGVLDQAGGAPAVPIVIRNYIGVRIDDA